MGADIRSPVAGLETNADAAAVETCLGGFQCAIHLACRLELGMIRSSYINALVNFTALDTVRQIVPKYYGHTPIVKHHGE